MSEGQFLGEITPVQGRWFWPFSEMKEGDWFIVDNQLRDHGRIMNFAHVTAHRLNRRFSVTKTDKGFTRVERVSGEVQAPKAPETTKVPDAMALIRRCYGFSPNTMMWTGLEVGQFDERIYPQLEKPKFDRVVCDAVAGTRYCVGIKLLPDRVIMVGLPEGSTVSAWTEADRVALLEA